MTRIYRYLGDRATRSDLRGATVSAVLDERGKCHCGRNAVMGVEVVETGERVVVLRRMLRRAT